MPYRFLFVRWFLAVMLLIGLGGGGSLLWIESPAGTRTTSRWIRGYVSRQFPGTELTWEKIDIRWPLALSVHPVRWGRIGEDPILRVDSLLLTPRWLPGGFHWQAQATVQGLDLSRLDELLAQGSWQASGSLAGQVRIGGVGSQIIDLDLQLQTQAPGGTMSNALIGRLLTFMPRGEAHEKLLKALENQPAFHFTVGRLDAGTQGEDHQIHLLLDGDHLLDITIRLPRESIGLLRDLLRGETG